MKYSNTAIIRSLDFYAHHYGEYPGIREAAQALGVSMIRAAVLLACAKITRRKHA